MDMDGDHIRSNGDSRQNPTNPFIASSASDTPLASMDTNKAVPSHSPTQRLSPGIPHNMNISRGTSPRKIHEILMEKQPIQLICSYSLNSGSSNVLDIPSYLYDNTRPSDPIKFVESHAEQGKRYGAIKLSLDGLHDHLTNLYMNLDPNLFTIPLKNESLMRLPPTSKSNSKTKANLRKRLEFYNDLLNLHASLTIEQRKLLELKKEKYLNSHPPLLSSLHSSQEPFLEPSEKTLQNSAHKPLTVSLEDTLKTVQSSIPNDDDLLRPKLAIEYEEKSINNGNLDEENNSSLEKKSVPVKLEDAVDSGSIATITIPIRTTTIEPTVAKTEDLFSNNESSNWAHIPLVEGKPLDLFHLYSIVTRRGGYTDVNLKSQWSQVTEELGLLEHESNSVIKFISDSYFLILYPFELEKKSSFENSLTPPKSDLPQKIKQDPYNASNWTDPSNLAAFADPSSSSKPNYLSSLSNVSNGNGHSAAITHDRPLNKTDTANKRQKLNNTLSPRLGFIIEYGRSIRAKTSKGILINSPHLINIKPTLGLNGENNLPFLGLSGQAKEHIPSIDASVDADTQLSNYLEWIGTYMSVFTDSYDSDLPMAPLGSESTLAQLIDENKKYQLKLLEILKSETFESSSSKSEIEIERLEALFFDFLSDPSQQIRNSTSIPLRTNKVGSVSAINYQSNVEFKSQINGTASASNGLLAADGTCHTFDVYPGADYIINLTNSSKKRKVEVELNPKSISPALHPFNLQNLPFLPNSILGALSDTDLDSNHLTSPFLNIARMFSVENWHCEDHFTQSSEYLIGGAWKRWYFIPELDFEKFEKLLENIANRKSDELENSQDSLESKGIEELLAYFVKDDASQVSTECLLSALGSVEDNATEIRLDLDNPKLNQVINLDGKQSLNRHRYFITPDLLKEHGIEYFTTIQKPGEIIYKYPKTYSCSISFGVNISEKVNFASKLWLDYGLDAENWLALNHLLPNFLMFKLCINLIHQLESSAATTLHFEADVYAKITHNYSEMLDKELESRGSIRKRLKIKEITLEEKLDSDMLCDVDFLYAYPAKVVISVGTDESSLVSLSLSNFMRYLDLIDQKKVPDLVNDPEAKVEMHVFLSDEKLRALRRLLQEYSMDFLAWQQRYDELLSNEEEATLRAYKTLLSEGQKITVALSGLNHDYLHLTSIGSKDPSGKILIAKIRDFEEQLAVLKGFVDKSSEIVEQCQTILAVKHQQRIRNGGSAEAQTEVQRDSGESLELLVELCNKIPKLNFHAPEFEQVFEFRNEIESFDRSCRQLLNQKSAPIADVKDMVSLGSSFGMNIPSLLFLVRLQSKLEWLKTYDTIVTGGDPFLGKKEIFLLPDMEKFRSDGLECLAASDLDKLTEVDQYIAVGHELDRTVNEYISANQILNHIDLKKLEEIMVDMEDRVKLSGAERLFVQLSTYQKLVELKSQETHIQFLQSFKNKKHSLFEVKQTLLDLKAVPFEVDTDDIIAAIGESEAWLTSVVASIDSIHVRRPTSVTIKQTCNTKAASKLKTLVENCKVVCADSTSDPVELSSPYMFYNPSESSLESQATIKYCLCRDFEDGAMIECDRCHEWFHFSCVSHLSAISEKEDEKYSCPACLVLETFKSTLVVPEFPEKLLEGQLTELIMLGETLKVQPVAELNLLKELSQAVKDFRVWVNALPPMTGQASQTNVILLDELMCRKAVGAPVIVKDILDKYLRRLLTAVKPPPPDEEEEAVDPNLTSQAVTNEAPDASEVTKEAGLPSNEQAPIGQLQIEKQVNNDTDLLTQLESLSQANGSIKEVISGPIISSEHNQIEPKDDDVTISEESSIDESRLEEPKDIGISGNSTSYILSPDANCVISNTDTEITSLNGNFLTQNIDPHFTEMSTAVEETLPENPEAPAVNGKTEQNSYSKSAGESLDSDAPFAQNGESSNINSSEAIQPNI